jgi:regulatory protein
VYLDGEEWRTLPAEVLKDVGIRVGSRIEPAETEGRIAASLPAQAWERALRLLNFRERGSAELARRLADDGYPDDVVAATVTRSREIGFLDDRRFADAIARGLASRGLGRRRMARELEAKGVDEALAAEMLARYCDEDCETERAERMAARFTVRSGADIPGVAKRLVAKGFETGVAWAAARKACGNRLPNEDTDSEDPLPPIEG